MKDNEKPSPALINDLLKYRMSNSGCNVVWDGQWKRWCRRGNTLTKSSCVFHPLCDKPPENHWIKVLTNHLTDNMLLEGVIGFKVNVRDPMHPLQSDIFRCHPSLYSNNKQRIQWYDFVNVLFNMGGNVHEKYPARARVLFCQVMLPVVSRSWHIHTIVIGF
jgi:hypothetical protein